MRRLLSLTGAFVIAGTLVAQAAGPVYTIPADYEKMKKVIEGLAGTTNLNRLSDTQARNVGANVKSFVEGATGRSTTTYSPSYFRAYGNNYRQFVSYATGRDVGATTNGNYFRNAGRNYKSLAEGMTQLAISGSYSTYYSNFGKNTRNFLYNLTGNIPYYYSTAFSYAGRNLRYGYYYLTNGSIISSNGYSSAYTTRQKVDQLAYDVYVNPNGLKKVFSSLDSRVNSITQNLRPITRNNRAGNIGGIEGGVVGYCVYYSSNDTTHQNICYFANGYKLSGKSIIYNGRVIGDCNNYGMSLENPTRSTWGWGFNYEENNSYIVLNQKNMEGVYGEYYISILLKK